MRLLIAGFALLLMVASASAQLGPTAALPGGANIGAQADQAARRNGSKPDDKTLKANENAYNAAIHNLPNKQYDPWHGVR